ncbi:hypothetical protein D1AOALGA4SA_1867 [Olavius algarvensis Delta 1 endosymbiont]|nr:hypothetical protein D1AOALGA4SA_1867 [Olavius algarvensis Delta 1 endosymbiont]
MEENNTNDRQKLASDIEATVNEACQQLRGLSNDILVARPKPGDWSVKEIIGHLVDSAANNHQRFVRLQVADGLVLPDYSQDNETWVAIQGYQDAAWDDLLDLWRYYNLHLARVIGRVNQNCIDHVWVVNEDTSFTLGELMTDYLRHLKDHMQQIKQNIN